MPSLGQSGTVKTPGNIGLSQLSQVGDHESHGAPRIMKLADRLTRMIDGMPDGASITLPVAAVKEWVSENGSGLDQDLTVEEVGKFFDRSPVTIRTWIRDGRLRAYRFQGREYRIPEAAVEEFQQKERGRGME